MVKLENMKIFAAIVILAMCIEAEQDNHFYDLLGVQRSADQKEIRKAFKKLALSKHPDKNTENPNAHEEFLEINRAYEVLKDEDTRKKYDTYGEEGLKEDGPQNRRYESWNFYKQNFGIYDDDAEIITLSRADFEASVQNTEDLWFVNYYSPHCSHCHLLAPDWRELARELEGVIRIGAVNCEDDWRLCQQQGIRSYPSLIFYPHKERYYGEKSKHDLLNYALRQVKSSVLELNSDNFGFMYNDEDLSTRPWLISYCGEGGDCLLKNTLIKLSAILEELVNVAEIDCHSNIALCTKLDVEYGTYYYKASHIEKHQGTEIVSLDAKEISSFVLAELPDVDVMTGDNLQEIFTGLKAGTESPWLLQFIGEEDTDLDLRKLPVLLNDINMARVDCRVDSEVCKAFHFVHLPLFAVFKSGGGHEIYHGRQTAHDIAAFSRDSSQSSVRVLSPDDFPHPVIQSQEPWFVDFYAPWCPPCMRLLPEFRKAAKEIGEKIHFGTVDCATHGKLCETYQIRSYPTTLFYNQSIPHQYHGHHNVRNIIEFLQDTLHPPVMMLDNAGFESLVNQKQSDDVWLVDFYAPWCGPCQQLAGEWRKLAKMLAKTAHIHIAQVDCDANKDVCGKQNIRNYPSIKLYPTGQTNARKSFSYSGWFRDAQSLRAWAFEYLPSSVTVLNRATFNQLLQDSNLWIVDFYAPWCGHCQVFAPEYERIAQTMKDSVKAGKVDCDSQPQVCQQAGIRSYPTVRLYQKPKHGSKKDVYGEEIDSQSADYIINLLKRKVAEQRQNERSDL